jgi:hypothetical protein
MGTRLKLGTKSAGDGAAEHVRACKNRPEKEQEKKVANLAE